jgi:hypothetical protein
MKINNPTNHGEISFNEDDMAGNTETMTLKKIIVVDYDTSLKN